MTPKQVFTNATRTRVRCTRAGSTYYPWAVVGCGHTWGIGKTPTQAWEDACRRASLATDAMYREYKRACKSQGCDAYPFDAWVVRGCPADAIGGSF